MEEKYLNAPAEEPEEPETPQRREPTREEKAKKRRRKRILKAVFWIAVLGVAAWFFLFGNDVISFRGIKNFFIETFTTTKDDQVATLNGTSVIDVRLMGSDVLVLSDIGVMLMSGSGRELLTAQHGCASPAVVSCGDRFLVFDRGGARWELYSKDGLMREGAAEYDIIDAAVASNGAMALVTSSKSYHNEVHYYDSDGAETYVWYSADNYIYKVGMRYNGKAFTALGMSSDGGESAVIAFMFDPRSKNEPFRAQLGGNIFYYVSYKGSNVTLIGAESAVTLNDEGETENTYDYEGMALKGYSATDDRTVLVFSKYGVGRDHTVVSLDSDGELYASADVSVDFRSVSAGKSGVTLLGSHEVFVFSKKLEQESESETSADGSFACISGDNVFVFGVGSITKIAV
ncbi:MAG: hypothetical protein J5756_01065 [Clostridia bacterium]|nr:hypothetical protein [Clostridia bacterium]